MNKEDILMELQAIKEYMEDQDAYYGYGQMTDLINKLEQETIKEQGETTKYKCDDDEICPICN